MNQLRTNRRGFSGMSDLPGLMGELSACQNTYEEVFCKELGPSSTKWYPLNDLSGSEHDNLN